MNVYIKDITEADVKLKDRTIVDAILKPGYNLNEMKYITTIDLDAGDNVVTTTLTTEPYNVFLLDSSGNDITSTVTISLSFSTVYSVTIGTSDALAGVKLKILY